MAKPTIWVGTWTNGLFAITDQRCAHELPDQPVRGLAPDNRGGALAIVGEHSLQRREPNSDWVVVATSEFPLSCCLTIQEAIYVGTDDARMLRLSGKGGVLRSLHGFDNVAGRESWFAGSAMVNGVRLGPPLGVRSVTASANGRILFANVHVGGVPRSIDGGETWQPTLPIDWDVHEVRAHPSNSDIVVAAAAVGVCISRDSGATWVVEEKGLHARHCSAIAFAGDDILVSASQDPFAAKGRIYRKPLSSTDPFDPVEGGMPMWTEGIVDTGCIAANGSSIAVADKGGNIYGSEDSGRTWSRRSAGLPAPSGVLVV